MAATVGNLKGTAPRLAETAPSSGLHRAGRFYHAELDGLRFCAFFAVFLYHTLPRDEAFYVRHHVPAIVGAAFGEVSRAGRFGVDLFFVLSGYLITELLVRESALSGHIDVGSFYVRRALRIWPLYFLMVAIGLAASVLDPSQGFRPRDALWFLLFTGNWAIGLGVVHSSIVIPLWTVNVEEQFYLVWPWIIRRPTPRRILRVAALLVGVAWVARLGWAFAAPERYRAVVSNDTFAHIDAIASGGALAVLLRARRALKRWERGAIGVCGVALVLAAGAFHTEAAPTVWISAPLAAAGCVGVFAAVLVGEGAPSLLKHSSVVYLGRISYGLYIYHYAILRLVEHAFGSDGLRSFRSFIEWWCISLVATVVVSAISYRFVERPFIELKRRFTYVSSRPE